jgi:hypothetical protein
MAVKEPVTCWARASDPRVAAKARPLNREVREGNIVRILPTEREIRVQTTVPHCTASRDKKKG